MSQFDVVIVGGAMTGSTLAMALDKLSQQSLNIAIVERCELSTQAHPGFDARSIALSHGSVSLLQQLELWQDIFLQAAPIQHIHISDRSHAAMTEISHQECHLDALGYVVELFNVGQVYQRKLQQNERIHSFCPAHITTLEQCDDHVDLTLNDGTKVSTKLVVAADGAMSSVCQLLDLQQQQHDTNQVAIIANIECEQTHTGRAFERFTSQGPLALLPMQNNRMSLVWCVNKRNAQQLQALPEREFLQQLQQAFGWRLGRLTKAGQCDSYPLIIRQRIQNTAHRVAVVGNAAQALHPIAGQGFNLALRDVMTLAEEVTKHCDDVGQFANLHRFQQRRQHDRENTLKLTSGLVNLFSNDWPALTLGRNLGLRAVDQFPLFKTPLLRRTLGLVER